MSLYMSDISKGKIYENQKVVFINHIQMGTVPVSVVGSVTKYDQKCSAYSAVVTLQAMDARGNSNGIILYIDSFDTNDEAVDAVRKHETISVESAGVRS